MAEKMLHYSTRQGMTRSSSHLTSFYDNDSLELVWENGPILVQGQGGGSTSSTRKTPSCNIGYSINPLRGEEGNDHEDDCVTKRARLSTSHSLLHIPARSHRHSDMDPSSNRNSHQSKDQDSCQHDLLQFSKSKSLSKLQDGCANLRQVKEYPESMLARGAHARQPATTGNGCLCTYSPQQCLLGMEYSSQTPARNSQKQDFICDQRPEKVNFSNLLRPAVSLKSTCKGNSAILQTNNTVLERVEEIKAGKVEKTKTTAAAIRSKAPDHSVVIDSAKGSHGLLQEKRALIARESKPVSLVARSHGQEPLPDEHSEAVGHHSALSFHRSQDQHYNQTSSSAGLGVRATRKADANFCNEPLLASSSVCSLGASNDPNLCSRKHEDTDDSTYLSEDNEEEPGDVVKETPAREGTRVKRSRNAETHNLYERKRRDKINKKMRVLKELIPNCNKMDRASMLDDAIEYLKTLKLQLQIMSMGTGLCMPLMMLPAVAHHINTPHLHQLMGAGMGFRPGSTGIPCSLPQFPIPPLPGITDNRLQMFGFPNQMPPMPISHAPFIPMIGNPSTQPLLANSTATNLAKHLPSEQLTTQAERATKQAPNQVSHLHH